MAVEKTPVFPKIESKLVTRVAASTHEIVNGWQKTTGCQKYSWVRSHFRAVFKSTLVSQIRDLPASRIPASSNPATRAGAFALAVNKPLFYLT